MKKGLPIVIVVVLLLTVGYFVWQKSQVVPSKTTPKASETLTAIKKVDLSTQPGWVQKLVVTATKGVSGNGLSNVTVKASGFPAGMVTSLSYVVQYETTNKGTQGALSTSPINVGGAMSFTKTIDFGTCSTKSCVRHDGVTKIDLELDFKTSSSDKPVWTGTLSLQ